MKKLFRNLFMLSLALLVGLGNCSAAFAAEQGEPVYCENLILLDNGECCILPDEAEGTVVYGGESICCESLILLDGGDYYCILTDEFKQGDVSTAAGETLKTQKAFCYSIYSRDGEAVATVTVTVTGVYSDTDSGAITSIAASCDGDASGLSYRASYDGDSGQLNILLNETEIGSLCYALDSSGIEWA